MNIGVIGSGNVGGTLGSRWAQGGHTVVFGTRDPKSKEIEELLGRSGSNARAASLGEAVSASDILLLATPWAVTKQVLQGLNGLGGKVLIDATNPVLPDFSGLEFGGSTSGAEHIAEWAVGAKVVKAFNTVGFNIMANPKFESGSAAMLYCGDDAEAKKAVGELASDLGFVPADVGPLAQARLLEPVAMLWISMAVKFGFGRDFAYQLMRR